MTYAEFLLLSLAEELGELQKECFKCIRFGPDHSWRGTTNFTRLQQEWQDVVALLILLETEHGLDVEALGRVEGAGRSTMLRIENIRAEWNERHPEA